MQSNAMPGVGRAEATNRGVFGSRCKMSMGRVAGIETEQGIGAYCPVQSMVRVPYDGIIGDDPSGERSRSKDCAKYVAPRGDTPTT